MIRYVKGDATRPLGDGPKIITHVCNNAGGWGAGFVLAVSRRWSEPEAAYRRTARSTEGLVLGDVQFVEVGNQVVVANMVAQVGYGRSGGREVRLRYQYLRACLLTVAEHATRLGATIHMPRIGCGLAGGSWDQVEPIIKEALGGLSVTVYDL